MKSKSKNAKQLDLFEKRDSAASSNYSICLDNVVVSSKFGANLTSNSRSVATTNSARRVLRSLGYLD